MTGYDEDFYTWTQEQAAALRRHRLTRPNAAVDWEHVIEEIESLGNEQADKLESAYRLILMHLLKWVHQPHRRSRSWRRTIGRERLNEERLLRKNPGLKSRRHRLFLDAYADARKEAANETGLPLKTFPETCPWTLEQVMDPDFRLKENQP
jgi:hypothetical protein